MGNEINIDSRVKSYLKEFQVNIIDIDSTKLSDQLKNIEEYFLNKQQDQQNHYKSFKDARKVNINKLSQETSISRSSIYNNPNTLQKYIEHRITMLNDLDIGGLNYLNKTEDKIKLLENINDNLQVETINSFEKQLYTEKLEKQLESLLVKRQNDIQEIINLKKNIKKLQEEIKHYKRKEIININKE